MKRRTNTKLFWLHESYDKHVFDKEVIGIFNVKSIWRYRIYTCQCGQLGCTTNFDKGPGDPSRIVSIDATDTRKQLAKLLGPFFISGKGKHYKVDRRGRQHAINRDAIQQ